MQRDIIQSREDAEGNENIANQEDADRQRDRNRALGSR